MISIVIPLFNEQESILDLYSEICNAISSYNDWEIIFIDDGSSDGSAEKIIDIASKDSKVKLISFYRNFGKSAALSEGFKNANGDIIITMDADLQDDPAEIPNFVNKINEGSDLVSGWKKVRHDPWAKTFPSKIFNFVTRLLTGVKIHDFNCGLKAYRSSVIKSIEIFGGRHRYIPALAGQKNFSISEIIVNHRPRKYGTTKYGGNYKVQCGTTKEWRAASARNGAYNSIAFKNPWKTSEFTIVENTTAPRFEKGKVIVSSSGNEVSVRSCWADGCNSSNRKLDIIVTD